MSCSNRAKEGSLEIPTKFVEKARFVRVIFTDVEKEYDALLRLMTLGLDWTWRRRMISKINFHRARRILDLACGTGLVAFALSQHMGPRALVVGLDPSSSMLRCAIKKKHAATTSCEIELVRATGEFMPLRDGLFEYETIGLALRNLGDRSAVFSEAHRTLADSGWFLSVDFVVPSNSLIQRVYMFYIFNVLPSIGRLVSGCWHRTLTYLARSIQLSAPPPETCNMLTRNGFQRTLSEKITLGVVVLIGGRR
jgi:demethylmenaquinone methyltransferase/2-methoxy-6-polyprenyl-1,4-benzoquinol methylase